MRIKTENLVTITVRYKELFEVMATIKENRVRHMPLRHNGNGFGYLVTIEDGPVATMLKLKYEK